MNPLQFIFKTPFILYSSPLFIMVYGLVPETPLNPIARFTTSFQKVNIRVRKDFRSILTFLD